MKNKTQSAEKPVKETRSGFKSGSVRISEEKTLDVLMNATDEFIFLVDTNQVILNLNQKAAGLLGCERAEMIGKKVEEVLDEDTFDLGSKYISEVSKTGKIIEAEEQYKGRTLYTRIYPIREKNEIVHFALFARDISQDVQIRKSLQKSEELYKSLFEFASDAIFIMEGQKFIECNKATLEIYGCKTKDDILRHSPWEFSPETQPDGRKSVDKAKQLLNRVVAGETIRFYWKHTRKDRSEFDAEVALTRIPIENQMLLLAIVHDITQNTRILNSLKESEKKFRAIFEDSPVGMYRSNKHGKLLDVNRAMVKMLGYPDKESLLKADIASLYAEPEERSKHLKKLEDEGIQYANELKLKNFHGSILWVQDYSRLVKSKNEEILCYEGSLLNKTKEREALIALQEREEKYRLLAENSNDVIWTIQPDGKFTYISPSVKKLRGYTPEEVLGKSLKDALTPASFKKVSELIRQAQVEVKNGSVVSDIVVEIEQPTKDGSTVWTEASISPVFKADGKFDFFLGVTRDISERKINQEELLKAKEKAEESDKLKSAFLANMSHEIRTPMNAILGFSQLLTETDNPLEQEEFINIINSNGEHLLKLINDIIDISKIEAGILNIEQNIVNLNTVIDDIYKSFFQDLKIKEQGIELIHKKALPDKGSEILTDETRLKQIMTNLLGNAVKFTHDGYIEFGYRLKSKEELEFYVKDTGRGIDQERLVRIFDRFFQAENNPMVKQEGTGLGLAITKALVELLGGQIHVKSIKNKGSEFYFNLPYKVKEQKDQSMEEDPKKENLLLVDHTILIVEDNVDNYYLLSNMLKKTGAHILWAKTGEESINMVRKHEDIDLILMDIRLPEMDGYTATRKIKEINQDIPVIAQTAFAFGEDKQRAVKAGCVDYLPKPLKKSTLIEKIKSNIRGFSPAG